MFPHNSVKGSTGQTSADYSGPANLLLTRTPWEVAAVLEDTFSGNPTHNGKKVTDMKRILHDGFTRKLS
jgi:hypothetical protein